jgi:hypothetical protein
MDMSKVSQGQMIAGIAGVVLLVSLFLDWVSGITITNPVTGASISGGGGSAFDVFSAMDIIMLIVAVVAIAWAVAPAAGQTVPPQSGLIIGLLGVAIVGFTLGFVLETSDAGIGAWLGFVASIALTYGAFESNRQPVAAPAAAPTTPAAPPPTRPAV